MYLNDLADVLRRAGLNVVEVGGWRGHNHGAMRAVRSIVCHHTAGPWGGGDYPSFGTVRNGRPGLPGPLSQLGLGRSGTVYVFSNGVSWHAGTTIDSSVYGNYYAIGIEAENAGTGQPWPPAQVEAYAKLCAALCKHYNIPVSRVRGHKEICYPAGRKIDPHGLPGDMNGHRARVQRYMRSGGGSAPPAAAEIDIYGDEMIELKPNGETSTATLVVPRRGLRLVIGVADSIGQAAPDLRIHRIKEIRGDGHQTVHERNGAKVVPGNPWWGIELQDSTVTVQIEYAYTKGEDIATAGFRVKY